MHGVRAMMSRIPTKPAEASIAPVRALSVGIMLS